MAQRHAREAHLLPEVPAALASRESMAVFKSGKQGFLHEVVRAAGVTHLQQGVTVEGGPMRLEPVWPDTVRHRASAGTEGLNLKILSRELKPDRSPPAKAALETAASVHI
jgi:hypothetical protein